MSGDTDARVKKYTTSATNAREVIIAESIPKGSTTDKAATDLMKSFLGQGGKDALFDSKITHIGIACGCHI